MKNPIDLLIEEHDIITKAINSVKSLSFDKDANPGTYNSLLKKMISFFQNYADGYHHYKEETILFPAMCDENDMLKDGIINEMLDNHNKFRNDLKEIEKCLNNSELDIANKKMMKYFDELLDHISIENDEVFPMAENLFSNTEMEKLYYSFIDADNELGLSIKAELVSII